MYDSILPDDNAAVFEIDETDGTAVKTHEAMINIEFDLYLKHVVSEDEKESCLIEQEFDILMWWRLLGAKMFPKVARVARSILSMPSSSSMSETNFSNAGGTITKKRSNLKPYVVNDLLFIRSNSDICPKE